MCVLLRRARDVNVPVKQNEIMEMPYVRARIMDRAARVSAFRWGLAARHT